MGYCHLLLSLLFLCSLLPLISNAQSTERKLDSVMRLVPTADVKTVRLVNEIHGLLAGLSRAEQTAKGRRIIYFIDSLAQAGKSITGTGLYIKARIQKDMMLYMQADALKTTGEAAEIAERDGDNSLLFLCLAQESHINSTIGNYREAVRLGNAAIALVDKIDPQLLTLHDWTEGIASIYNGVGVSYNNLEQYDSALAKLDEGEKVARQFNESLWVSLLRSSKSGILVKTGRINEALDMRLEFYRQGKLAKDWRVVGGGAISISDLYVLKKDLTTARLYLDSALLAFNESPDHEDELRLDYWNQLAKLENARGNYQAAFIAIQKFNDGYKDLKNKQQAAMVTNVQASYDFDKNQRAIETLQYDNKQQRTFFIASIIVLTLTIILAVYFIYSYRRQRKATQLISSQRDEIAEKNDSLALALDNLKATQEQLVQSEKMSSLGLLTAGIAHEINNPVNFVQSGVDALNENMKNLFIVLEEYDKINEQNASAQLAAVNQLKQNVDYDAVRAELRSLVKVIRNGTERTSNIVARLQRFSRKGNDESEIFPITKPIDETISLIQSELKNRINVETAFEPGLTVEGRANELEQVFMNILMNASQAIKDKGTIKVSTKRDKNQVVITIRDSGPGIPDNVINKIFDPFFTTKPVGKGMGLGLSITHGIIKSHQGDILAKNNPDGGAEFIIKLPLKKA